MGDEIFAFASLSLSSTAVLRARTQCPFGAFIGALHPLENRALYVCITAKHFFRVIKSRIIRLAGRVARMGERRGLYRVLVRKPEEKRQLGRPRRRW